MFILIWIVVALLGLSIHYTIRGYENNYLDIIILTFIYLFTSPIMHIAIWTIILKPKWSVRLFILITLYTISLWLLLNTLQLNA